MLPISFMLILFPEQQKILGSSVQESTGECLQPKNQETLFLNIVARRRKGSTPLGYKNSTFHRVIKVCISCLTLFRFPTRLPRFSVFQDFMIQGGDFPKVRANVNLNLHIERGYIVS